MIKKKFLKTALCSLTTACLLLPVAVMAEGEKSKVLKPCMQCHKGDPADTIRGKLSSVSMKAETLSVSTGNATWLVGFDEDTALHGAEALNKIDIEHEVRVTFTEEDGQLYAKTVDVKPPTKLDPKQLIKIDVLAPLVEKGPQAGNFTIVDARPGKLFLEGHIPGAISIYDAQFDDNLAKLPKNKDQLLVFYCGGPT